MHEILEILGLHQYQCSICKETYCKTRSLAFAIYQRMLNGLC